MKKPAPKESPSIEKSPFIQEKDILSDLVEKEGSSLLLGRYTMNEVIAVLIKRNFLNDARKRNLWPLTYELDSSEFPLQRLQIFYKEKAPENLIVDLKIKEGIFKLKVDLTQDIPDKKSGYDFLILDWLTLQNPLQRFSDEKTPLPGQNHPGLNLGKKVLDIFIYLARLRKKDALLAYPAYFHNALLFSRQFRFLNPQKEAEVMAVRKSFPDIPFKELAWIVHLECLRDRNNKVYEWQAEEQVFSLNKSLKSYFGSKRYKERVKESLKDFHFSIDRECYERKREAHYTKIKTQ
ncbi:MAG: hypothetical protein ACETWK_00450 [Candidatus Aminicenantaceae bacterium]